MSSHPVPWTTVLERQLCVLCRALHPTASRGGRWTGPAACKPTSGPSGFSLSPRAALPALPQLQQAAL